MSFTARVQCNIEYATLANAQTFAASVNQQLDSQAQAIINRYVNAAVLDGTPVCQLDVTFTTPVVKDNARTFILNRINQPPLPTGGILHTHICSHALGESAGIENCRTGPNAVFTEDLI